MSYISDQLEQIKTDGEHKPTIKVFANGNGEDSKHISLTRENALELIEWLKQSFTSTIENGGIVEYIYAKKLFVSITTADEYETDKNVLGRVDLLTVNLPEVSLSGTLKNNSKSGNFEISWDDDSDNMFEFFESIQHQEGAELVTVIEDYYYQTIKK